MQGHDELPEPTVGAFQSPIFNYVMLDVVSAVTSVVKQKKVVLLQMFILYRVVIHLLLYPFLLFRECLHLLFSFEQGSSSCPS